jgi:hypothetical protein
VNARVEIYHPTMEVRLLVETILRVTCSLGHTSLRVSYVSGILASTPIAELARALDLLCARAEQAEEPAREVLLSIVDALSAPEAQGVTQLLREEAAGESLLSLERLVRPPLPPRTPLPEETPKEERVPDYGKGRTLTLGERKSLARRPDRNVLERLLLDPHPDVISRLLKNPRLTEDDVVRLAARRPGLPDVLTAIARDPKWLHRARVRLTLVLNPDTPGALAAPIVGLLMRQDLRLVAEATHVPAHVRALCIEHLERRPPGKPERRPERGGERNPEREWGGDEWGGETSERKRVQ